MLDLDETPKLFHENITFYDVLKSIDTHKMGFTTVVDSAGILKGIITNADVRKSLIRNYDHISSISVDDMLKSDPAFVYDYETVTDILTYIKSLDFPILFMPVVDQNKKLVGSIKFNNLIKGES
ncbi:MAG TPA: hypothetical protein PKZ43_07865 [Bacteroidales bacterium]|nr:hypothetical protein [Bacteroidales bacterium]